MLTKLKAEWTKDDYFAECARLTLVLLKLVEIHNHSAQECGQKFGEAPQQLLVRGYEE